MRRCLHGRSSIRPSVAAAKKFDRAENVLVARPVDVTEAELHKELRDRTYVRQLQIVQCDDDDVVRAVHDYLRSATHRTNWSEGGDVIESSFDELESSLDRAWKSQKSVIDIERGRLPTRPGTTALRQVPAAQDSSPGHGRS